MTMREVRLSSRKYPDLVTLIDDSDFALIEPYSWHPDKRRHTFYARAKINGRHPYMHSFITGWPNVDHKDGNGLNNQRSNLREATQLQQLWNRGKQNGPVRNGPYKGVFRSPPTNVTKPWRAAISVNGKRKHLGLFATPEEAALAYDKAAREAFGPYARVNFPLEGGE